MKVKYINKDSTVDKEYLELNKEYEVNEVIIHDCHTTVYLKGFGYIGFNSCCFDENFREDLHNAISYFWNNPHEDWYGDIFFRDF